MLCGRYFCKSCNDGLIFCVINKSTIKNSIPALILLLSIFAACSKNEEENISIRIENKISLNLKEVINNNKSFKDVKSLTVSPYQLFDKVIAVPAALLITGNNDTLQVGAYILLTHLFPILNQENIL